MRWAALLLIALALTLGTMQAVATDLEQRLDTIKEERSNGL